MAAEDPRKLTPKDRSPKVKGVLFEVLPNTVKINQPFKPSELAKSLVGLTGFSEDYLETMLISSPNLVLPATPEIMELAKMKGSPRGWYYLREDYHEFNPDRNEPTKVVGRKGHGRVAPGRRGRTRD